MFGIFKRKPKQITLFAVTQNYIDTDVAVRPEDLVFYTLTSTRQEAEEYINKRLYIENKQHFKSWCELRELDFLDVDSWFAYVDSGGLTDEKLIKYIITKVRYRVRDVATVFRMHNKSIPIGTSYEEAIEYFNIIEHLSDEQANQLEKRMKEEMSDNQKD